LNPVGAYPVQITLDWRLLTPNHGAFSGRGEITGELRDRLQLTHNITGAATLELHGEVRQPLTPQPAWSAQAQLNVADLKPFAPELAGKPLTAQLDAQGVLTQFQGQGEIAATLPELGPATLRFTASGNDQGLKLDQLRLTAANRPLTLTAGGEVQFAELRFDAGGQWQSLVWPLTGSPQVESAQGEFAVKGAAKDYQFQLAAEVQGPDVPRGRWTLRGQGSDQAVREVKLSGQTLEGAIEGNANVAWLPAVRWQAALTGTGLNPGAQWPDVPGKLNVRLKSEGVLEPSGLKAHALIEELAGTLSGQELRGNAEVAIQGQNLMIKTLRLNAGDARLEAEGALTQRWDVRWKLDAPQLQGLVPGLSGAIASSGALSGSRDRPAIAASFTVQKLRRGDTQIQQLRGEANVDVSGASRSQLKVTGDGLMLGGQNWKSFTLDGSGTPSAHDLKAELVGDPGRFLLALAGSLQTPSLLWQGRITQLSARDTVAGAWNLDQPAAARTSNRQANLDAVCLSSAPTRICVQGPHLRTRPVGCSRRFQGSAATEQPRAGTVQEFSAAGFESCDQRQRRRQRQRQPRRRVARQTESQRRPRSLANGSQRPADPFHAEWRQSAKRSQWAQPECPGQARFGSDRAIAGQSENPGSIRCRSNQWQSQCRDYRSWRGITVRAAVAKGLWTIEGRCQREWRSFQADIAR